MKKTKDDVLLTIDQVKAQLIETGKKNGHLSHEEIADKLQNFEMDSDHMDEFFEAIAENDITLINEKDAQDTDDKINLNDLSAIHRVH